MAGFDQLGAEDDPRPEHPLGADRPARRLEIAEPVLHRDEHPIAREMRRDRERHGRGVVRLDGEQHGAERAPQLAFLARAVEALHAMDAEQAVDGEATAPHRVHVRAATEERDRPAGTREQTAHHGAEGTGARDQYALHGAHDTCPP
jgi:hypothetical protein